MKYETYLTHHDVEFLGRLAEEMMRTDDQHGVGGKLVEVLSGAAILPAGAHKADCVALYSQVGYSRISQFEQQKIRIVGPFEVDRHRSFVSILSPIGLALIGKKVHDIATVSMPLGYMEHLKIMSVEHYRNGSH